MKVLAAMLYTGFIFFAGAYAHEGDIQRNCKEHGETNSSGWRGELNCSPKINEKDT